MACFFSVRRLKGHILGFMVQEILIKNLDWFLWLIIKQNKKEKG